MSHPAEPCLTIGSSPPRFNWDTEIGFWSFPYRSALLKSRQDSFSWMVWWPITIKCLICAFCHRCLNLLGQKNPKPAFLNGALLCLAAVMTFFWWSHLTQQDEMSKYSNYDTLLSLVICSVVARLKCHRIMPRLLRCFYFVIIAKCDTVGFFIGGPRDARAQGILTGRITNKMELWGGVRILLQIETLTERMTQDQMVTDMTDDE